MRFREFAPAMRSLTRPDRDAVLREAPYHPIQKATVLTLTLAIINLDINHH